MYEQFLGLGQRPFAPTPNVDCFVETATARDALENLRRTVTDGGAISLLTAPAGLGKTLVCRRLVATLPKDFDVAFVPSTNFGERRTLLLSLLFELGATYTTAPEDELRLRLDALLRERAAAGRRIAVVLDEAHLLETRILDEVRTLVDTAPGGQALVSIVLSGQLALEENLAEPGHEAVNQRIQCHAMLESLTRDESRDYVAGRITWAGGRVEDCFDDEALELITRIADGNPRALNQLCDQTLLLAHLDERRPADAECVLAAYEELRHLPQQWNAPPSEVEVGEMDEAGWSHTECEEKNEITESHEERADVPVEARLDDGLQPTTTAGDVKEHCEMTHESSDELAASVFEVGSDPDPVDDDTSGTAILEVGWEAERAVQPGPAMESGVVNEPVEESAPVEPSADAETAAPRSPLLGKFDEPVEWTEEVRVQRNLVLRGIALDPAEHDTAAVEPPVVEVDTEVDAGPLTADVEAATPAPEAPELPDEALTAPLPDTCDVDPTPLLESALGFVISTGDPNEFEPVPESSGEFVTPEPSVTSEHVLFGDDESLYADRTEFDVEPVLVEDRLEPLESNPDETELDEPTASPAETVLEELPAPEEEQAVSDVVGHPDTDPASDTRQLESLDVDEEFTLERQIETNLREIARETAKALASRTSAERDAPEYDIVEPERFEPEPDEDESWLETVDVASIPHDASELAAPEPVAPATEGRQADRPYARLFSELKRRHRESRGD